MESNLFAMMQREWRQTGGHQTGVLNSGQVIHDSAPSPTVSASRKKQKITSSVPAQSFGGPSPSFHPQPVAAPHQPSSVGKRGSVPGHKGKKQKPGQVLPGASSIKQYPSSGPGGRNQVPNRVTSGTVAGELAEGTSFDSLNGRRLWTRWRDDNNFYEAVITDYNPVERRHHLVYDMGSTNETWEWVNLSEDSTFEFERKRNRPERYDRNLADSVLKAIPKIDKIRVSREERHHKNSYPLSPANAEFRLTLNG